MFTHQFQGTERFLTSFRASRRHWVIRVPPLFRTATQRNPQKTPAKMTLDQQFTTRASRKAPLRKAYLTGWVAWSAQFEIVGRQKGQRARWRSPEPRVRHGDVAHSGFDSRMQRCTKLAGVFTIDCFIFPSFSVLRKKAAAVPDLVCCCDGRAHGSRCLRHEREAHEPAEWIRFWRQKWWHRMSQNPEMDHFWRN